MSSNEQTMTPQQEIEIKKMASIKQAATALATAAAYNKVMPEDLMAIVLRIATRKHETHPFISNAIDELNKLQ